MILCVTAANILQVLLYTGVFTDQTKQTSASSFVIYVSIFDISFQRFSNGRRCSDSIDSPLFRCDVIDAFPPRSQVN